MRWTDHIYIKCYQECQSAGNFILNQFSWFDKICDLDIRFNSINSNELRIMYGYHYYILTNIIVIFLN